jgi:hypothetical protein
MLSAKYFLNAASNSWSRLDWATPGFRALVLFIIFLVVLFLAAYPYLKNYFRK